MQHAYNNQFADACYGQFSQQDFHYMGDRYNSGGPYAVGIESYLDPKYASNPAAFAARLPYLPFQSSSSCGAYDYNFEPAFIRKRNERERQRVKCVNEGYARLREHLPDEFSEKRLSKLAAKVCTLHQFDGSKARINNHKVETLRGAIQYIAKLQKLLGVEETSTKAESESVNTKSQKGGLNGKENTEEKLERTNQQKDKDAQRTTCKNNPSSCRRPDVSPSQETNENSNCNKWNSSRTNPKPMVTASQSLTKENFKECPKMQSQMSPPLHARKLSYENKDLKPKADSYYTKYPESYDGSLKQISSTYLQENYSFPPFDQFEPLNGCTENQNYYFNANETFPQSLNFNLDPSLYSSKHCRYNPYYIKGECHLKHVQSHIKYGQNKDTPYQHPNLQHLSSRNYNGVGLHHLPRKTSYSYQHHYDHSDDVTSSDSPSSSMSS